MNENIDNWYSKDNLDSSDYQERSPSPGVPIPPGLPVDDLEDEEQETTSNNSEDYSNGESGSGSESESGNSESESSATEHFSSAGSNEAYGMEQTNSSDGSQRMGSSGPNRESSSEIDIMDVSSSEDVRTTQGHICKNDEAAMVETDTQILETRAENSMDTNLDEPTEEDNKKIEEQFSGGSTELAKYLDTILEETEEGDKV